MSTLNWITPAGNIANIEVNTPISIELIAHDSASYSAELTYTLIGGSLPDGMSLSTINTGTNIGTDNNPIWSGEWVGVVTGTPSITGNEVKLTYNFIVRVNSNFDTTPIDRSFTINVTNVVNNGFNWVTPAGSLGTVPAGDYYSLQILTESNSPVTYKLISGEMPIGTRITPNGYIQGVPTFLTSVVNDQSQNYRFTVRATNQHGQINDRSFDLTVTSVTAPVIEPTTTLLGSFFDGTYFTQQLSVVELNPLALIQWSITDGELPLGVTLDSNGLLSGYLQPLELIGIYGPAGYDGDKTDSVGTTATMSGCTIVGNVLNIGSVDAGTVLVGMTLTGKGLLPNTQIISSLVTWNRGNSSGQVNALNQEIGYPKGSVVIYAGNYYIAQVDVLANTDFNPLQWSSSTWSQPTYYNIGDNVTYQGVYYAAKQQITAGTPWNSSYWNIVNIDTWKIFPAQAILSPGIVISGIVDTVLAAQEYDYGPYDFTELSQSKSYLFTVQAFDGANYDLQKYVIQVVSRSDFTADNNYLGSANNSLLTVDSNTVSNPVLLNSSLILPPGRQNAYYAFKFQGFDFSGDTVTYSISNTLGTFDAYVSGSDAGFDYNGDDVNHVLGIGFDYAQWLQDNNTGNAPSNNLPGLTLDANTGWLYGKITPTYLSLQNFVIGVVVSKTSSASGTTNTYSSVPTYFTLPVLGDVNDLVQWITSADLGTINNGSVSELAVEAKSTIGKELVYTLYDAPGVPCGLPQGLTLLPSGEISGRVSFETFSLDGASTTFDNKVLTIDRKFDFMVEVRTADMTANAFRQFTVTMNIIDVVPYDNLYLKAMPSIAQRQIFNSLVTDTSIFDTKEIYRPTDPWFGVTNTIDMLFLPGLTPKTIADFEAAMVHNHWTKIYNFGSIQTAVVLDDLYNVKYEVVYINILDEEQTTSNTGPGLELDLSGYIKNPYIDANGNTYTTVYPNTTNNMIARLEAGIGFADQSSLPPWMTSNQPDLTSVNKFRPPLGFTKAVVLAYTKPGASKSIAYRLQNKLIEFNNIEFAAAGYLLDNYYSTNYNVATNSYVSGLETTFDYLATKNIGAIVARVNYGVDTPFSEINGRSVEYVRSHGGIDGILNFQDGDTVVFITQENFAQLVPYDGWINYYDSYIGDNINTDVIEGYDSEAYDRYTLIPGYLESVQGNGVANKRGGIWKINIVNNKVSLSLLMLVNLNDRIQILTGKTHAASIFYYSPADVVGHTVPYYKIYNLSVNAIQPPTTFNKGTTRFFSNRDQYYTPNSQDKYLKFPQYGVFN